MTNTRDFVTEHNITAEAARVDQNPNMDDSGNMDHWRVVLKRPGGKRMSVYYSMGIGHHGKAPEAADVLDCLASDGTTETFEDWCADFGYDSDSRKAHRTYTLCKRQDARLWKFLGEALYTQLQTAERL